ncbi:hypothetical protein KKA15_00990 [Patescibacteria group bacterium]|nr:hypothetical protein [Patescibacteria group bacterium]
MEKVKKSTSLKRSALVAFISVFAVTMVVGAATTIDNNIVTGGTLDVAGGDITLQNDETIGNGVNGLIELGGHASTTGNLYVSGGTFDLTTSTATTTTGLFVRDNTYATSTLGVGGVTSDGTVVIGCIELVDNGGQIFFCYINDAADGISCSVGRCTE